MGPILIMSFSINAVYKKWVKWWIEVAYLHFKYMGPNISKGIYYTNFIQGLGPLRYAKYHYPIGHWYFA